LHSLQFRTVQTSPNLPWRTVVGFDAAPGGITAIIAGDEAGSVGQVPSKMSHLASKDSAAQFT